MSPEDREALLEQLGLSGSADRSRHPQSVTNVAGCDGPGKPSIATLIPSDFARPPTRRFRPDDSLLIDIDFKKDKPARIESQGPGLPPITIPAEPAPVLDAARAGGTSGAHQSRALAKSVPAGCFRSAVRCPASLRSCWRDSTEEQATHRLVGGECFPQARRQGDQAAGTQVGRRGAQAVWLRPVQGWLLDLCARDRRAGAFRLRRRAGRPAQRSAVRQPEPHICD